MLVHKRFHKMKSLFFLVNIDVHIHLFFLQIFDIDGGIALKMNSLNKKKRKLLIASAVIMITGVTTVMDAVSPKHIVYAEDIKQDNITTLKVFRQKWDTGNPNIIVIGIIGTKKLNENAFIESLFIKYNKQTSKLSVSKIYNSTEKDKLITEKGVSIDSGSGVVTKIRSLENGNIEVAGNGVNATVALTNLLNKVYPDRSWKKSFSANFIPKIRNIKVNYIEQETGNSIKEAENFTAYSAQDYELITVAPKGYKIVKEVNKQGTIDDSDIEATVYLTVDVDNRKAQAKADIDAEAAKVKGEIDADGTLTAEEKGKQKASVDQEAEKAKGAIDAAKDIDGVNQAKADGIKAIDDQHKSGDPVDNRKAQAKADIDAEAAKVKGEIDADGTLTAEEKGKQKASVDQEAEKAKGAIDAAKDIDGVNQAKADGIKAIDDQHKSGNVFTEVQKYQKTRNFVPVQTKALPYVEDKKTSMSYSNSLPKTGESKTMKLLLLGVIGVLGSLISFVVLKKRVNKQDY